MSDAELIYNACLRAERRLGAVAESCPPKGEAQKLTVAALMAVQTIREELGHDLAKEWQETKA